MFEWDENKARANLAKHRVSFETVTECFEGPMLEREDPHSDEDRIIALGAIEGVVFNIVYTYRGNRIRIISARKATRHDHKTYFQAALQARQ